MNILIIEDDQDIAELIAYNLKQEKIDSSLCSNGSLGLSKAKKIVPDLIILDLMLPDMDGLEISRLLKQDQKTKHIPILMLTAKSEEIDRIVGFEVGAADQYEYSVGLNHFFVGHGIKLQLDYTALINVRGQDINDNRIRAQMQVIF